VSPGQAPPIPVPRYGEASLPDLTPSLLSSMGIPDMPNPLGVDRCEGFCLFLIDGLGWEQVRAHGAAAPFLASHTEQGRPITAPFPSTTSASLGSVGTGLPPGEHGLIGYTFAVQGFDRPMNSLLWELYGIGPHVGLADAVVPEEFQPHPTMFERAQEAGLSVSVVGPPPYEGSPFSRAVLRGGDFLGAYWFEDIVAAVASALRRPRPAVYVYHPDLDTLGHGLGAGADQWVEQLARFDRLAESLAGELPRGGLLVVTGDHGMVNLEEKVDVADRPELMEGVRMMAGDARARQLYVHDGAAEDVLGTWREVLGDRMWVVPGPEAMDDGWFGPRVDDSVRRRIGDVIAAAHAPVGVFQRDVDPLYASLLGHHGSMTPAEQLVPLIEVRS
jgi:hypothetical protein